jgi:NADH dehydrogenase
MVTVFGGSGFIGAHVVQALGRRGYRVRVAVRRPNQALYLKTSGVVGQIEPVQANIRDEASVRAAIDGASAVINLAGILSETGKQRFAAVHIEGAARVARASRDLDVPIFIHMSSLSADPDSASAYASSKAKGEAAVFEQRPDAVILRPSAVFGPEDQLFNRFASLARLSPVLPVVNGETSLQPVYAKDVAEAVLRTMETNAGDGKVLELGGPETLTIREIMELTLRLIRRKRALLPLPAFLARIPAYFIQLLPNPLVTVDQLRQLQTDNLVSAGAEAEARTLAGLGIAATAPQAILPTYLTRYRRRGQFEPGAEPPAEALTQD